MIFLGVMRLNAAVVMDLSLIGRCALSVAMPVLSAMGVQTIALPTALLSAHTGGFGVPAKRLLDGFMSDALDHWQTFPLKLDAIHIGYLASAAQVSLCERLIEQHPEAFVLLDPAMADHGRLYSGIEQGRPEALRPLTARADLITPNLTEAQLLTGLGGDPDALLDGLLGMGAKAALITGAGDTNLCAARDGRRVSVPFERVPENYPGTGDLFSAVLLGALLRGEPTEAALGRATDFVHDAARATYERNLPPREGVAFEPLLAQLL